MATINQLKAAEAGALSIDGGTLSAGAIITHANASSRGAVPNGEGGESVGIRDICSAEYSRDWALGIEYFRNSDGTVNVAFSSFDAVPDASFDVTKGYVVGSHFVLRNGNRYVSTDVSEGAAVWNLVPSGTANYELKSGAFTADAGHAYAVDTTEGSFDVTLPASWSAGQEIRFMDAKGTWNTYSPTFLRNGNKIEGVEIDYVDSAQGTFFSAVYVDASQGVRILESGTKPHNLVAPSITGHFIGGSISGDNGTWTGAPFSYVYQHQISDDGSTGWADIEGATSSSYTPISGQETKYIRRGVAAVNANGTSAFAYSAASAALEVAAFPAGALAFWKLDDLTDSSGNGRTLTNANSASFVAGKVGNCVTCDGTNGLYCDAFDIGDVFTVAFWLKTGLASNDNICISQYIGFCVATMTDGTIYYGDCSTWNIGSDPGVISANTWALVIVTSNAGEKRMYVDNVLVASDSDGIQFDLSDGEGERKFGINTDGIGPFSAANLVDALGVWPRVIASEERTTLWNSGNGLEPA